MSPSLIALIIQLVELAIQEEPAIAAEISALLTKANPTPADWSALRQRILDEKFSGLAPNAAANLPPPAPAPAPAPVV